MTCAAQCTKSHNIRGSGRLAFFRDTGELIETSQGILKALSHDGVRGIAESETI